MSGRGRGRGRGSGFTFNTDGLGLARSDILEISRTPRQHSSSSLYPPLQFKVLPLPDDKDLEETEEIAYSLGQRKFNYVVKPVKVAHNDVQRYSDKYYRDDVAKENYDYSRMPVELRPVTKKKQVAKKTPVLGAKVDFTKTFEQLEAMENIAENEASDEEKEEAEEEGVVAMEEEEYEEDEQEEGTDYNSNYFDNGEGYLDEEEDNLDDDGPIYS